MTDDYSTLDQFFGKLERLFSDGERRVVIPVTRSQFEALRNMWTYMNLAEIMEEVEGIGE